MVKKFRRRKPLYQYKSPIIKPAGLEREKNAYKKFTVSFILLLVFSVVIYLKGLDFIAFYSSFFRDPEPLKPTPTTTNSLQQNYQPRLNSLPVAVKENEPLKISGQCPPGFTVIIQINERHAATLLADIGGHFKTTVQEQLQEGPNRIVAVAVDNKTNSSYSSLPLFVDLDTQPPQLEINYPSENMIISDNNIIEIQGQTESEKIIVTINDHRVIVDLEGLFSFHYTLEEGENQLTVLAQDRVGHLTKVERTITFRPETTPTP